MNWEAVSAVSDFLAAIAVIVTLVYLAVQIRQNTSTLKSSATQGAHEQTSSLYELLASDPELSDIFVRGLETPEALDRVETARFFSLLLATMFKAQNWFMQTQSGAIDGTLLKSWVAVMRQFSALPGWQDFWRQRRHVFAPDFVAYIEAGVLTAERDPDYRPLGVNLAKASAGPEGSASGG